MNLDPHRYDDIINLERPVLKQYPPLSAASHAAQFAPFAALTGYHETIKNTEIQPEAEPRIEYFADESTDTLDI